MADDQQQPGQPPAGAPGSWPPPPQPEANPAQPGGFPPQPGYSPPPPAGAPGGWAQPQQPPAWGQQPQQPGWGQAPQQPQQPGWGQAPQQPPAWGQPPAQPYGAPQFAPPPQPGFAPPFGAPVAYPPAVMAYGPQYAGFWIRFFAYIIDGFIWGVLLVASAISIIVIVGLVLFPVVLFGYFPILWWKRGATFGQSLLGLRVVRAIDGGPIDGSMAGIRALVFYAELFFSGWIIGLIGFAWAAFEPRKRAWHDMAAGTVVIHTN